MNPESKISEKELSENVPFLVAVFFCYTLAMKKDNYDELKTIPVLIGDSYDNDGLCDFLEAICEKCGKNTTPILSENKSETAPSEPSPK